MVKGNGFQGKVLTHLEYIKKKQDSHDDKLKEIENRMSDLPCKLHDQRLSAIVSANRQYISDNRKWVAIMVTLTAIIVTVVTQVISHLI